MTETSIERFTNASDSPEEKISALEMQRELRSLSIKKRVDHFRTGGRVTVECNRTKSSFPKILFHTYLGN